MTFASVVLFVVCVLYVVPAVLFAIMGAMINPREYRNWFKTAFLWPVYFFGTWG